MQRLLLHFLSCSLLSSTVLCVASFAPRSRCYDSNCIPFGFDSVCLIFTRASSFDQIKTFAHFSVKHTLPATEISKWFISSQRFEFWRKWRRGKPQHKCRNYNTLYGLNAHHFHNNRKSMNERRSNVHQLNKYIKRNSNNSGHLSRLPQPLSVLSTPRKTRRPNPCNQQSYFMYLQCNSKLFHFMKSKWLNCCHTIESIHSNRIETKSKSHICRSQMNTFVYFFCCSFSLCAFASNRLFKIDPID